MTPEQLQHIKTRLRQLLEGYELRPSEGRALAIHFAQELVVRIRKPDDEHSLDAMNYLTAMAQAKPRHEPPRISK